MSLCPRRACRHLPHQRARSTSAVPSGRDPRTLVDTARHSSERVRAGHAVTTTESLRPAPAAFCTADGCCRPCYRISSVLLAKIPAVFCWTEGCRADAPERARPAAAWPIFFTRLQPGTFRSQFGRGDGGGLPWSPPRRRMSSLLTSSCRAAGTSGGTPRIGRRRSEGDWRISNFLNLGGSRQKRRTPPSPDSTVGVGHAYTRARPDLNFFSYRFRSSSGQTKHSLL